MIDQKKKLWCHKIHGVWRTPNKGCTINKCKVLQFILLFTIMLLLRAPTLAFALEPLCAEVKIEIRQELTLERQAFDAHMRINNGLDNIALENVAVEVLFADKDGNMVLASTDGSDEAAVFFIRLDSMDGIDDVSGNGTVSASSAADIHWLIIPAPGASNGVVNGSLYYIGATLSYTLGGVENITEITPDYIFVKPMPELTLDYFLPTDVYGDDAFTPEIEPPIPFSLGVRISNNGFGTAQNLKIESAQPKIIENEQNLLINFNIEGSQVNGLNATPSLLVDLGEIEPEKTSVARWQMTASLSGKFLEFSATFSHSDELGGTLTSLIESVETHSLVHDVQVDLPGRDSIRDFLANDNGIYRIYESDNIVTEVLNQSSASTLLPLSQSGAESRYKLTTPLTGGFIYVQLSDPHLGSKVIQEIIRSDGKQIKLDNGWLSKSRDANNEWLYYINLFDVTSSDHYTIIFNDAATLPDAPVLQFIPDRTISETNQISFVVEASDPDGTVPAITLVPLPPLASFIDQGNGSAIFSWTPAIGQEGSYTLTFSASDTTLSSSQKAILTVYSHLDRDGDGLPNSLEEANCTNPDSADSDNDGISDGGEDVNQNGISDPGETDPCKEDTDNDGYNDLFELQSGSDPLSNLSRPPGQISGLVVDTDGTPLTGVCIEAYIEKCSGEAIAIGQTDGNGEYSFSLSANTYYLRTDATCDGTSNLQIGIVDKSWTEGGGTENCAEGQPVAIEVDQLTENINFSLRKIVQIQIPGDINGDGSVSLGDAILALRVITGQILSQPVYSSGDVNGDGKIGLTEVVYILRKLAGYLDIPGEINGDGTVDLKDAVLVLQLLTDGQFITPVDISGDVDGNERIGIAEAVYILREVASQ